VFSGGGYDEVGRWLGNFLTAHAKRVDPRIEVELEMGDAREGKSYGARLRFGREVSAVVELDYREVADNRGGLRWCSTLAARTRGLARALSAAPRTADGGAR
jgi:hypothetical protein